MPAAQVLEAYNWLMKKGGILKDDSDKTRKDPDLKPRVTALNKLMPTLLPGRTLKPKFFSNLKRSASGKFDLPEVEAESTAGHTQVYPAHATGTSEVKLLEAEPF